MKKQLKKPHKNCPCVFATKIDNKRTKRKRTNLFSLKERDERYYCPVSCIYIDFNIGDDKI